MDLMWGMWNMALMGLVMALGWTLIPAAIGLGIWWLVRGRRRAPGDQALAILRERYARGEISREEFESRRGDLAA